MVASARAPHCPGVSPTAMCGSKAPVQDWRTPGVSQPLRPMPVKTAAPAIANRVSSAKKKQKLENTEENKQPKVGSEWAKEQVKELLDRGAPGFHLYALNQSTASLEILDGLKI